MKRLLIWFLRIYQRALSPFIPHSCRFTPSCSSYFLEAVEKHGVAKGCWSGLKRLCRCHPFGRSGFDPVS